MTIVTITLLYETMFRFNNTGMFNVHEKIQGEQSQKKKGLGGKARN
jgi:hypothetical protein